MSVFDNFTRLRADCQTMAAGPLMVLPVSKTFSASAIQELYDCGVRDFGESRLSELTTKAASLPSDIRWHYIGNLQSKKVRKVVQLCHLIHSVNSVELIERLDRICAEEGKKIDFLLELNVSNEESKTGAPESQWLKMATKANSTEYCRWTGLMTMTPENASSADRKTLFNRLKKLRDEWQLSFSHDLPILSMGMSSDYPAAIAAGSTLVRVGTAIFGERQYDISEPPGRNMES